MNCKICNQPMRLVPAGVSKTTGKSYSSFWACPDRTHKQPRVVQTYPQQPIYQNQPQTPPQGQIGVNKPIVKVGSEVDWDKISWGKCKYGFLIEAFKMGKPIMETEEEAELWATMSMRRLPEGDRQTIEQHKEMYREEPLSEEELNSIGREDLPNY